MKQNLTCTAELVDDPVGNITRINNVLEGMADKIKAHEAHLETLKKELVSAKNESERSFPKKNELMEKSACLTQLNQELEGSKQTTAGQSKNSKKKSDLEAGEAPALESLLPSKARGGKASIRAARHSYTPSAPVPPDADRRKEAAL